MVVHNEDKAVNPYSPLHSLCRSTKQAALASASLPREEDMEKKVVLICAFVGFLGILSSALGFAAEATRIKVSDVQMTSLGQCSYPKSPALALGLLAAVALMIAQAIINTVAGCICCKNYPNPSDTNWTIGLISFIASWITFIIAFVLLLSGAALNNQWGQERMYFGEYCYVVKAGVFIGGAVLSLASVSLGIVYYVSASLPKSIQPWNPQQSQGVAMGHPQPQMNPVFVHEDTYNRQQFP
ncbi:protein MODIFYING WALL LIGNIN-2-like [Zingiber officinale]|uniref:Uncharacterized protein n=1 Tax=Zingiber officinale TaxID=94328 RepID=A0A8J5I6R1_ZINOF|nr:protein MODIFYING WALL LIGNIN-2-like [Zingiber officinale]KAG6529791.1 hypothetical protein ZIOFF_012005 [Zingiber officinale]